MKDKKYIMVGAPIITKEIFRNVLRPLDNYTFKPSGGFWASEYIGPESISDWYKYLIYAKEIAKEKNINQSTIFTLKENAKILTIDTIENVLELSIKYPSYHHLLGHHYDEKSIQTTIFDFEKISKDYDGIYVNVKKLRYRGTSVFNDWNVNSLLLFNLDCIKEYQTTPIIYDINNYYDYPYIEENKLEIPQKIEEESSVHKELSTLSKTLYLELINRYTNYHFEDYNEYFTTTINSSSKVIELMLKHEYNRIKEIDIFLQSKSMKITKERIITNIVLNNLTEYLIQDKERIITLSRTKIKTLTWYNINK